MRWEFQAADAGAARFSRRAFVEVLRSLCAASSDFSAAELVFTELVANVVRHAPGPIHVAVETLGCGTVMLAVTDTGAPFAIAPCLPPSADLSDGGRGLFIVANLCPRLSVFRTAYGNTVQAVLPVEALSQASAPTAPTGPG